MGVYTFRLSYYVIFVNGVLVSVLWPILETVLGSEIELARQYQGLPYVGWLMTGTV
jgi:hypothetical protein